MSQTYPLQEPIKNDSGVQQLLVVKRKLQDCENDLDTKSGAPGYAKIKSYLVKAREAIRTADAAVSDGIDKL